MLNLFPEITVNAHCPFPCWYVYVYSFFFFLTLEADKSESKTFNKVGPENSTWKNYLSAKFQSYSEYACAVPDMTFTTNRFRNDRFVMYMLVNLHNHVIPYTGRPCQEQSKIQTILPANGPNPSVEQSCTILAPAKISHILCPKSFANLYAYRGLPTMREVSSTKNTLLNIGSWIGSFHCNI